MDTSVSDALSGRLLSGRYRVGERLARGGMATVYVAEDTRLERTVALKVMHPDLADDTDFVARFVSEARASAKLSHPDVVGVYDQGEDAGWVWLAMEYVRGRTLRTVLAEHGRLDPTLALETLEHVLSALASAHDAGIVHRDVKPENVLVARDGRVKVADFGLARAVSGGSSTATRGVLLGTVAYLSPEQALGQPATRRSDVYSTGVMLFELLTGSPPHQGATDYLVVRKHIEVDVPAPSLVVAGVPPVVDEIVAAATAREPADRYADAGEFLGAVSRARAAPAGAAAPYDGPAAQPGRHSVVATSPGWPDALTTTVIDVAASAGGSPDPPAARRPRRRRRWLGSLLALALVAGAGGAAYWYGWARWDVAPSLLKLTAGQARTKAQTAGLDVAVDDRRRWSETMPAGQVLATDPEPGARVLDGSTVTLVLSRGPQRFAVPSVVGRTQPAAVAALRTAALVAGEVTGRYDERVPRGEVLSQGTDPGSRVKRGTAVSLVLSRGPRPIPVPDLTGRDVRAATKALRDVGLRAAGSDDWSDTVPKGDVAGQSPRSGTLARGDTVRLVVSRGPRTVRLPDVEGGSARAAERRLGALGVRVRVVTFLPGGPGQVLRQSPGAGTEVAVGSTVTLYAF